MKTEIINKIHFVDGLEAQFINNFKNVFPKENLTVTIESFTLRRVQGLKVNACLTLDISTDGKSETFSIIRQVNMSKKLYFDLINNDSVKRTFILSWVKAEDFIEQLDEFLEELKGFEV